MYEWNRWISVRLAYSHCNTLQHTATHCNTLQHTTTHSRNRWISVRLAYSATISSIYCSFPVPISCVSSVTNSVTVGGIVTVLLPTPTALGSSNFPRILTDLDSLDFLTNLSCRAWCPWELSQNFWDAEIVFRILAKFMPNFLISSLGTEIEAIFGIHLAWCPWELSQNFWYAIPCVYSHTHTHTYPRSKDPHMQ